MFSRLMAEDQDLASRLGIAVAAARKKSGFSQEALAERLNVSKNFIGLIERGQSLPSVPRLTDLADALGLSLDHVLLAKSTPTDRRWTSKTAALLDLIAPEFHDLVKGYLHLMASMRPLKPGHSQKKGDR
jgi:transcriptional regulator with XRE-family HTH domain